ncbi:MAG: hypothetical protein MPJ50_16955 [Pirellulales bacterium]|nr:hypothetical protein [Pirellulales bacterium]
MTRRRPKSDAVAVSLFPFLAVLLCTMGALIVLLVMLSLQAKDGAADIAGPAPPPAVDEDALARHAELVARADELATQRAELSERIAARIKELEDIDIEGTRLEEELASLDALRGQLRNTADSEVTEEQLRANLTWYENKLIEAEAELRKIKQRIATNPVSYAIVPYLGGSGTYRRPLYIECTDAGVILQPEGVILRADDFAILAANNPLVSAIRTTIDYWQTQGRSSRGEAYPLLLVRPDGALAFHAAKTALEFWNGDFGYELVDEGWNLEFSPPDAELAQRQARAIDNARKLLSTLRRGNSGLVAQATRPSFRVATQGSLEQLSPGAVPGLGGQGAAGQGSSETGFDSDVTGSRYGANGAGETGTADNPFANLNQVAADSLGGEPGSENGNPLGIGTGTGTGGMTSTGTGHQPNQVTGGAVNQPGGEGQNNYIGLANPANDAAWRQNGAAGVAGATASGAMQPGTLESAVAAAGTPQMPGSFGQPGSFTQSSSFGQPGSSFSTSISGAPSADAQSPPSSSFSFSGAGQGAGGSAGQGHRQANWALPNAGFGDVAVSRAMRVTLDGSELTIYSMDPQTRPEIVYLQPQTADSLDDFRAAVWREMDRWGLAGRGMYWKPILKFEVTPAGADRYFQLKRLMENSGFVLESQRVLPRAAHRGS